MCGTEIQLVWNLHSLFYVLDTLSALNYKIYSPFILFFAHANIFLIYFY